MNNRNDSGGFLYVSPRDETLGGLLTSEGYDVRMLQPIGPSHAEGGGEEDKNNDGVHDDERRTDTWRGMALAPNALIQWDFAVDTFDDKVQAMNLSSQLILYVLFVVAFCLFFLVGRSVDDGFSLQKVVFSSSYSSFCV